MVEVQKEFLKSCYRNKSLLHQTFKKQILLKIRSVMENRDLKGYWRKNLKYLGILLTIWFTVSYGFG
ncbi:MAG: sodium/substrate symporter small subunit, partial [Balneolaceae bacterium]